MENTMKCPSISHLLLLLLFCSILPSLASTVKGAKFIKETCKKAALSDPNLSYNFCVTSLQAVPASHSANLQKLGAISANLALINSTNTTKRLNDLLKRGPDKYTKERLLQCKEVYSEAMQTLKKSITAFLVENLEDANIWVSAAYDDAFTCEQGFTERGGGASPLKKENGNLMQLCSIALSITHLLNT